LRRKHIIVGAVALTAFAGGTAGAVAATSDTREAEQAVLSDAANRLDVPPEELRSALRAAEDAQLDAAVRAGELTRKRAEAIKAHRAADRTVLRLGPGGRRGHRGGGRLMDDAARALGISRKELRDRRRDGSTLAEIAARSSGSTRGPRRRRRRSSLATRACGWYSPTSPSPCPSGTAPGWRADGRRDPHPL